MKSKFTCFLLFVCASAYLKAQSLSPNYQLTNDFITFFTGNWTGSGEFADGRKISTDLDFKLVLDSSWISFEHRDKLPNLYKAFGMWGINKLSGQFLAYSFDIFQGRRIFASDAWKDGKLILTTNEYFPSTRTYI